MTKRNDPFSRNDDFWDIEAMLPKAKRSAVFSSDTDTIEISVDQAPPPPPTHPIPPPNEDRLRLAREALKKAEEKHLAYTAAAFADRKNQRTDAPALSESPSDEPLFSYSPEGNGLIKRVTVRLWPARYSFYERFRRDALRYFDAASEEVPHVSFFSFTPQYAQLSHDQLAFYLSWRTRFRRGESPEADDSYLRLYLYEIINLPDRLPPEEGILLLLRLWRDYRKKHPSLDRHMAEWVCDYCLIHRLRPPTELYDGFLDKLLLSSSLKEFYLGYDTSAPSPFAAALFTSASAYNWRTSKFLTDENRHLFDTHIRGAFLYAFDRAEKEHLTVFAPLGEHSMISQRTVRDAFNGALCAYNVKRRIEVEYLSCSRSVELRYVVTDAIKFAENQLRGLLGIRSRFHTPNLAEPLKRLIEEYFAPLKAAVKKAPPAEPPPAYDALYEPLRAELSLSYAKDIEERSWATTELLTEEQASEEPEALTPAVAPLPIPQEEAPTSPVSSEEDALLTEALSHCLVGDKQAFTALAARHHLLPDALCEALNDRLYDVIGDIAVEQGEDGVYRAVVDYLEELNAWMKK